MKIELITPGFQTNATTELWKHFVIDKFCLGFQLECDKNSIQSLIIWRI